MERPLPLVFHKVCCNLDDCRGVLDGVDIKGGSYNDTDRQGFVEAGVAVGKLDAQPATAHRPLGLTN